MTIIYSNMGDEDCRLLEQIWEGLDDVKVVEIRIDTKDWRKKVNDAIEAEDDTLMLMGHGTSMGLLFPSWTMDKYLLDINNVGLIHAKNVFCCWCNANRFCEWTKLHCVSTSMFISNYGEACGCGYSHVDPEKVPACENAFCQDLRTLMTEHRDIEAWYPYLTERVDKSNEIDVYNRGGIKYFG